MSNPTIRRNGVTFTFQDGDCEQIVINKTGNLDENPLPASDSNSAFIIDFNGVIKTITLSGYITEAASTRTSSGTTKTIAEQLAWLQNLVDGAQSGYLFNSTYQTNITVYCRKFNFTELSGDPLRVNYTLEFVEGG